MSVAIKEKLEGKVVAIDLTGKLVKEDYADFVPAVERLVQQRGKIRILMTMHDFHGWTAGALWEDTKFATHHFRDIERLAMVGEKKWQKWMAAFCKPFTAAEVHYFDKAETEKARAWLEETDGGAGSPPSPNISPKPPV